MILLQQMLALFVLIIIGYFCGRAGILDRVTTKNISWLVVNVANVAMILQAGLDNQNGIPREKLMFVGGIAVAMYAVLVLLAMFLPRLLFVKKEDAGSYRTMLIFSNIGFMGIPLLAATVGGEAVLYTALFQFLFNILIYTYGIAAMRRPETAREQERPSAAARCKKLLNAGVISCIVALVMYFGKADLPDFADTVLKNLANLTAPLSMLVIGQSFTEFKIRGLFTDVRLLAFAGIKLLVLPVAGLFVLKLFVSDPVILKVCLVMLATPVASMTAMLAQQYDGNYELASRGVALTTILSVATIPLVSLITGV